MTNLVPMRYNPGTGGYELGHTLQDPHYRTLPQHIRGNPRIMRMIIEEHRRAYHSISIIDMIPSVPDFICRSLFDAGKICVIDDAPDIKFFSQRLHHGLIGGLLISLSQIFGTLGKLMNLSDSGLDENSLTQEELDQYAPLPENDESTIYMGKIGSKPQPSLPFPTTNIPDIPGVPE